MRLRIGLAGKEAVTKGAITEHATPFAAKLHMAASPLTCCPGARLTVGYSALAKRRISFSPARMMAALVLGPAHINQPH